jgi:hypothetical protein
MDFLFNIEIKEKALSGTCVSAFIIVYFSIFVVLFFGKFDLAFFYKRNYFLKIISTITFMLRTILIYLIVYILLNSIASIQSIDFDKELTFAYFSLALSSLGAIILLTILIFSANLFNLCVPNYILPWSESIIIP